MKRTLKTLLIVLGIFIIAPQCFADVEPCDVSQFIVEPNRETILHFRTTDSTNGEMSFTIYDTDGRSTETKGTLQKNGDFFETTISLDQGYWEIVFENQPRRFGIVAVEKTDENDRDPFFAIDGALSWLVKEDQRREEIIRSAKRVGITMIRERFRLSGVAPEKGRLDWETDNRYEKLRKYYRQQGMEVQELFHNAPQWMGKVKVYPEDLVAFADVSGEIAKRWENLWGAIEMWNEPDISFGGNLPADQYVAVLRAFVYKLRETGCKTPIMGGVVAHFNEDWLETAKANEMLDLIDIFSFHTYDWAINMERIVGKYRNYLDNGKHGNMPLWLTECGRPWKIGPERPPQDQDFVSACDIIMKGVESKCCGVARYFPFVLPYYEERDSNFGMLDKTGTPLRSFAAYAQMIHRLTRCEYIGDLKPEFLKYENQNETLKRSRIFRNENGEHLIVLYTDKMTPLKVKPDFAVAKIERLTGEQGTADENGFVEIRDGLAYLLVEKLSREMIDRNTTAMRLYSFVNKKYDSKFFFKSSNTPVIPVYEFDEKIVTPNSAGYRISKEVGELISLPLRVYNLSEKSQSFGEHSIPAKSMRAVGQKQAIDPTQEMKEISIQGLQMKFFGNPTMESLLKQYPNAVAVPIGKEHWQAGIAGGAKLDIENLEKGVVFKAKFNGGDRWCYPRLRFPENIVISKTGSFFGRFRINVPSEKEVLPRMFLFEATTGSGYLSSDNFMASGANDQWIVFRIPVTEFHYTPSTPQDDNGQLDTQDVKQISVGFNTQADELSLELEALYYCE